MDQNQPYTGKVYIYIYIVGIIKTYILIIYFNKFLDKDLDGY